MMPNIELDCPAGKIYESINMLLHTPEGTIVNDRRYGLDFSALDYPPEIAEAMLLANIEEKLEQYEPRASLMDIFVRLDGHGVITMRVVIAYAAK